MAPFSMPVILRSRHLFPIGPFQEWDASTVRQKPDSPLTPPLTLVCFSVKRRPHALYAGSSYVLHQVAHV